MGQTVDLKFQLVINNITDLTVGTVTDLNSVNLDDALTDGVGLNMSDRVWYSRRTVTAAAETLDLTALTRTVQGNTVTTNFAKIKGLLIHNRNTTAAKKLTIGAAATNAWTAWSSVATSTILIQPDGQLHLWAPDLAAWAVSGTTKNLKIDPGADTIEYTIAILGTSS